jgi:hypothetical protein
MSETVTPWKFSVEGTRLGLSLTRKFIALHSRRIREKEPCGGTAPRSRWRGDHASNVDALTAKPWTLNTWPRGSRTMFEIRMGAASSSSLDLLFKSRDEAQTTDTQDDLSSDDS